MSYAIDEGHTNGVVTWYPSWTISSYDLGTSNFRKTFFYPKYDSQLTAHNQVYVKLVLMVPGTCPCFVIPPVYVGYEFPAPPVFGTLFFGLNKRSTFNDERQRR